MINFVLEYILFVTLNVILPASIISLIILKKDKQRLFFEKTFFTVNEIMPEIIPNNIELN